MCNLVELLATLYSLVNCSICGKVIYIASTHNYVSNDRNAAFGTVYQYEVNDFLYSFSYITHF